MPPGSCWAGLQDKWGATPMTNEQRGAFKGPPLPDVTAVDSLKMLLNYAMAEGSELGMPVFVGLLRMASLELEKSALRAERHVS
ncbi:MAG TPA: hypothetical protein VKW08_25585 [Xanthobacteraceae bacterium]|jgi:hypothetical protein|nr:hypothetical protein [Xanthobacteraceae bacterium]